MVSCEMAGSTNTEINKEWLASYSQRHAYASVQQPMLTLQQAMLIDKFNSLHVSKKDTSGFGFVGNVLSDFGDGDYYWEGYGLFETGGISLWDIRAKWETEQFTIVKAKEDSTWIITPDWDVEEWYEDAIDEDNLMTFYLIAKLVGNVSPYETRWQVNVSGSVPKTEEYYSYFSLSSGSTVTWKREPQYDYVNINMFIDGKFKLDIYKGTDVMDWCELHYKNSTGYTSYNSSRGYGVYGSGGTFLE